jgi:hypothetical protein
MSIRSIVSSPAFLGAWVVAGVPAAAMMCHDVALAVTTGAALPALNMALSAVAQTTALIALRLMGAVPGAPSGTNLGPAPGQNLGG